MCATRKGPSRKRAPLKIYNVGCPMKRVAIDVLGPLPKTEGGNEYILIAQDYFTKWVEAFPLPNQPSDYCCRGTSKSILLSFWSTHGITLRSRQKF